MSDFRNFTASDGTQLCYRDIGSGPPVVTLHGFPDTFRTWDRMADALAQDGYRVIVPALRGYLPSAPAAGGDYSVPRLASDLRELLDREALASARLIGHDWGASTAYATAALWPERVEKMAALAIPPLTVAPSGLREFLARPHNFYLGFGAISDRLLRHRNFREVERLYRLWSPHFNPGADHMDCVREALRPPGRSRAAVDYYRIGATGQKVPEITDSLTVPALVLYGSDEPAVRKQAFARSEKVLPSGSRIVMIDKVGHWPHLEAHDRCLREIREFFAEARV